MTTSLRVLALIPLLGLLVDCASYDPELVAWDVLQGRRVSPAMLARVCVDVDRKYRGAVCYRLATSASDAELVNLRDVGDGANDLALVYAVVESSRRDLRWLFAQREPRGVVFQTAVADVVDRGDPQFALSLAFLCRNRCDAFRRTMEENLSRWLDEDWYRATIAAATLGFLGNAASEPVLIRAFRQRHSWVLSMASLRSLRRLKTLSQENDSVAAAAVRDHWSPDVREAAQRAMKWDDLGGGYSLVSRSLELARTRGPKWFVLAHDLEPVLSRDWLRPTRLTCQTPGRTIPGECTPAAPPTRSGRTGELRGRTAVERDWGRLWLWPEDREWMIGSGSVVTLSPFTLLCVDHDAAVRAFLYPGRVTIIQRALGDKTSPASLHPIAQVPGCPVNAKVAADGTLLLATDCAAVVVDANGIVGLQCEKTDNQP